MVGIIIIGQMELSPFSKKYIQVLEEKNIPYEAVHWNRSGVKSQYDEIYHTYTEQVLRYGSILSKLLPFLRFRRFAKTIIKEKNYDKLIILTTQTAIILFDVLLSRKYKNKYFFDYRDTSYEYIGFYRRFINKIIMNSYATCISSSGFKKYLTDKKELIIAHNFQDAYYEDRLIHYAGRNNPDKIIIGYIGYLREYEYLVKLIDVFGMDSRFEFHIHGSGDCVDRLKDYAEKYDNVIIYGAYNENDKMRIVDSFDMICYNYPVSFVNYPAVANKFYDGMIRKKPMFANADTFSGEMIEKYGLGISLAQNETEITDKIFEYFNSFDKNEFEENCEKFLHSVLRDDERYISAITDFLDR
ncbi:MAG: hypothetical protein K5768_00850 [Firmicutes bacterium]|nr:hypothetical protein [Bacillota bacterium]